MAVFIRGRDWPWECHIIELGIEPTTAMIVLPIRSRMMI
jgi:hypothetical protein